jgi:hypothetical protein
MKIPKLLLKDEVKINGHHFNPEIRRMLDVVRLTSPEVNGGIWVTSANDGKHKAGSKHFTNEAFDIRIRNVKEFKWGPEGGYIFNEVIDSWAKRIRLELGLDYDVVYGDKKHLDHIHIEYDPK